MFCQLQQLSRYYVLWLFMYHHFKISLQSSIWPHWECLLVIFFSNIFIHFLFRSSYELGSNFESRNYHGNFNARCLTQQSNISKKMAYNKTYIIHQFSFQRIIKKFMKYLFFMLNEKMVADE